MTATPVVACGAAPVAYPGLTIWSIPGPGVGGFRFSTRELTQQSGSDSRDKQRWRVNATRRDVTGLVIRDLHIAGYKYRSISDLRTSGLAYRSAVPILLRWLPHANLRLQEEIVRALSVPWARPEAIKPLITAFHEPHQREIDRWVIGNALEVIADDSVRDALIKIALDTSYGTARQMIVLKLGKLKGAEPVQALLTLVEEPGIDAYAIAALGDRKVATPEAREVFETGVTDSRRFARKAAERGLRRLGGP